nr:MAG TPA_asm: putative cytoplasmic protein [Caudoviricetes sp.]
MTCDRKICTECTTRVNMFDFCPDCVRKIKITPKGVKE